MRRLYYDLLAIRRFWLPLRERQEHSARLLDTLDIPSAVLGLLRRSVSEGTEREWVAYFNLTRSRQQLPEHDRRGAKLLTSSESSGFGGSRTADDPQDALLPFEFLVFGPSLLGRP